MNPSCWLSLKNVHISIYRTDNPHDLVFFFPRACLGIFFSEGCSMLFVGLGNVGRVSGCRYELSFDRCSVYRFQDSNS